MNEEELRNALEDRPVAADEAALRRIVGRRDRMVARWIAGAAAVALLAGGGGGYVVARGVDRGDGREVATTSAIDGSPSEDRSTTGAAPAGPAYASAPPTKAFKRSANGVDMRTFVRPGSADPCYVHPPTLVAHLSDPEMVAIVEAPAASVAPSAIALATTQVVGLEHGSPSFVAVVSAGGDIKSVRLVTDAATDQMEPVDGWVVLVVPSREQPSTARVEGLDRSGQVVASVDMGSPEVPVRPSPEPRAGVSEGCVGPGDPTTEVDPSAASPR